MISTMAQSACTRGLVLILAYLFIGGCVKNDAVQPEETPFVWEKIAYPQDAPIECIAIDPDGRLFLGMIEMNGYTAESVVHVSSDNGESWTEANLGIFEIRDIAIDSEGRLFAGERCCSSIRRSRNHGESWEVLSDSLLRYSHLAIVLDSDDNIYLPTERHGIYFSSDHGESWTQLGEGFPPEGEVTSFDTNSKGCLFALAGRRFYRSCGRGESWTELQDVPWTDSDGTIVIDSTNRIFISIHHAIYRSSNDGETWTALDIPDEWVRELSIDGRDRAILRCISNAYVSNDSGATWTMIYESFYPLEHVASNAAGNVFVTGMWGISRSIDNGTSWEMLGISPYPAIDIEIDRRGSFYIGTTIGGIYRSTGNLTRWERFSRGLPVIAIYCLASTAESTIVAGTWNGVYVSAEDQPEWSLLGLAGWPVTRLFCFPNAIIAQCNNGLVISTDRGENWRSIGLEGYGIQAMIQIDDGTLVAGANFGGVFRYTGKGILWDQANDGLGDLRVNALAVTGAGDILAGTNTGIFISSNGCVSWRRFRSEKIAVTTILVIDENIIIGTERGIMWTRTDGSGLHLQNNGLDIVSDGIVATISDLDGFMYILTGGKRIYKSMQSAAELSPAGL